jgi:hypothetical protein
VHDISLLACLAESWQDQQDVTAEAGRSSQFQECLDCTLAVSILII